MNISSNNDSKRLKGICEEDNNAYYDASQKNKFDLKKNIYLGIIDENLKNNSFNDGFDDVKIKYYYFNI